MAPEPPHINCRITPDDEMWSPSDLRYSGDCLRSYAGLASRADFGRIKLSPSESIVLTH